MNPGFALALLYLQSPILLAGIEAGGSISRSQSVLTPHFRAGVGTDLIFDGGFLLSSRLEATQEIDSTFALMAGWAGDAFLTDRGFPLALLAGGAVALDTQESLRGGVRAAAALSLWYGRAVLEIDLTVLEPLTHEARFLRGTNPEVAVGLSIRIVPWSPWNL